MKLEKYEDKSKKKRKTILISLGVIVLISVSLLLYKTFASFTESAEFPIMNGKVDYFGNSDIYFVFYKGDELLEEMPQKGNEENLVFDHGECGNGASIEWDSEEWAPLIKGLNKVKTKCSLYFEEKQYPTAVEYITELAKTDTTNLKADDTSEANIRYIGASPNNYIDIGGSYESDIYVGYDSYSILSKQFSSLNECKNDIDGYNYNCTLIHSAGDKILWRVIGVMNNIVNLDNGGQQESLVKIIRADSIGDYSWDSSAPSVNNGYGVNEWSQADVMKLLNPNTVYSGTPTIGGSLYWNRGSGNCYRKNNEGSVTCSFTGSGLSEEVKDKIIKVRWNTGTFGESYDDNESKLTAKYMYEGERSNHNGKELCTNCSRDTISRTTTWDGYIGLIYPSDYGYAVGGEVRETCLEKSLRDYAGENCKDNNWLTPSSGYPWTMTPVPYLHFSSSVFYINNRGNLSTSYDIAYDGNDVYPVLYLKSSTIIIDGNGEKGTPFVASLN